MVAGVVSLAILGFSGVAYATAGHFTGKIQHVNAFGGLTDRPADDDGTNFLLVGSDDRAGLTRKQKTQLRTGYDDFGRHSDTMMIVHLASDGSVGVVSIPRDSYVEIPTYTDPTGRTIASSRQKINAAYAIGGPALTVAAVEKATGVRIDHYGEINFGGFVSMVDALGTVPVCTNTAIDDKNSGLQIPAGRSELSGPQSLAYVRARSFDPSADLGRMKRQQRFVAAMFNKASSAGILLNPVRLTAFLNATMSTVKTDENLGPTELMGLAQRTRGISPANISFQTIPLDADENIPGVGSVVVWDPVKSATLFAALRSSGPLVADTSGEIPGAPSVSIAPSSIQVRVYNATKAVGLGTRVSSDMRAQGYKVIGTASNYSSLPAGTKTVIQYDPAYDESLKTLQAAFPVATVKAVKGLGRTFRVIVGNDYAGVGAVSAPVTGTSPGQSAGDKPRTAADDLC